MGSYSLEFSRFWDSTASLAHPPSVLDKSLQPQVLSPSLRAPPFQVSAWTAVPQPQRLDRSLCLPYCVSSHHLHTDAAIAFLTVSLEESETLEGQRQVMALSQSGLETVCRVTTQRSGCRHSVRSAKKDRSTVCVYTHTHTHTHTHTETGILLSHKKERNNAICNNMNGPRDYHSKWSESDRTNIIWYHLYVESKKKNTNELVRGNTDWNHPPWPGKIVATCMSYLNNRRSW